MDYLYICKKGTTMWNEMSNPAVLMRIGQRIKEPTLSPHSFTSTIKSFMVILF
jgi:hypothetical protein